MKNFKKVVKIGSGDSGGVFCKISFTDGKLSITGVEGPLSNGNAKGGAGQIVMHDWNITHYAAGWNKELEDKFREVWNEWHLNDMQAGCEHQRSAQWGKETLEVVTYTLNSAGHKLRKEAQAEAERAALAGEVAVLSPAAKLMLTDVWYKDKFSPPDADSPLSGLFDVKKRENKSANWVHPTEHPRGVLGKECPVCGYKYGSAWLKEEVPEDVLEFLMGLPAAKAQPAWV